MSDSFCSLETSQLGEVLGADDRAYFVCQMRRQINSAVHRRINVFLLLDDGWSVEAIAQALLSMLQRFASITPFIATRGGLAWTISTKAVIPRSITNRGRSPKAELDAHIYLTAKEIGAFILKTWAFILKTWNVSYTPHALAKYLNRVGFCYKKPKCAPAKTDAEQQTVFLTETLSFSQRRSCLGWLKQAPINRFISSTRPIPPIQAHPAFGWMRKGATKELPSNHGRSNLNINGACHRQILSWPDKTQIALFEDLLARHPEATAIHVVIG